MNAKGQDEKGLQVRVMKETEERKETGGKASPSESQRPRIKEGRRAQVKKIESQALERSFRHRLTANQSVLPITTKMRSAEMARAARGHTCASSVKENIPCSNARLPDYPGTRAFRLLKAGKGRQDRRV